jgi:dTDP-3,4-didehydro-2,6-dideoxy-alpha-D-glucose 3-reductase
MIRIGIICPSEIALRRFLPALMQLPNFKYVGVAVADNSEWQGANDEIIASERGKAKVFTDQYQGKIFNSYKSIIESDETDAIYLPLPPALHYHWAKQALLAGKHILVEKPVTTFFKNTIDLIEVAKNRNLAVHENYMFAFHDQLKAIEKVIQSGEIGNVRLYRISFGFPRRAINDFRYNKALGGGALLDAGGYTIKYASMLLGESSKIVYAQSSFINGFDVDISGSAALINDQGLTCQIAFGMDNSYKCDLEVWGSKASLTSGRVLTAPAGFIPEMTLNFGNKSETIQLPADDAFKKSILHFGQCIIDETVRTNNYSAIIKQAQLVNDFIEKANENYEQ